MIESFLAWIFLVWAWADGEALYYVAAAGFAIAAQISRIVDRMDGGGNG